MARALATLALLLVAACPAGAQDLTGTWKRLPTKDSPGVSFFRFAAQGDKLEGTLLNPPEMVKGCKVTLELKAGKAVGSAEWTFEEGSEKTGWELAADGPDALAGKNEVILYDEKDKEVGREWEPRRFERVKRVGLVTAGAAEEPSFGEPADLEALAGGWKGPGGPWSASVQGSRLVLKGKGEDRIELEDQRGALKGKATLAGGVTSDLELAFDEGKLVGRASWREADAGLGDKAANGWSPVTFERLTRLDGGATLAGSALEAGDQAPLDGVWKRDDGLYLRLRVEAGQTVGVLSDKAGAAMCRVRLEGKDGTWSGKANWNGVEAAWELVRGKDGGLLGRCEWVDHEDGQVVARGFVLRKFTALRRVF